MVSHICQKLQWTLKSHFGLRPKKLLCQPPLKQRRLWYILYCQWMGWVKKFHLNCTVHCFHPFGWRNSRYFGTAHLIPRSGFRAIATFEFWYIHASDKQTREMDTTLKVSVTDHKCGISISSRFSTRFFGNYFNIKIATVSHIIRGLLFDCIDWYQWSAYNILEDKIILLAVLSDRLMVIISKQWSR